MNAASFFCTIGATANCATATMVTVSAAAVLTVAASLTCLKAWGTMREAQRLSERLKAQLAEIEAGRESNKRIMESLRALLRKQPLFASTRKFEEV